MVRTCVAVVPKFPSAELWHVETLDDSAVWGQDGFDT